LWKNDRYIKYPGYIEYLQLFSCMVENILNNENIKISPRRLPQWRDITYVKLIDILIFMYS
jgi:hypothetical protein